MEILYSRVQTSMGQLVEEINQGKTVLIDSIDDETFRVGDSFNFHDSWSSYRRKDYNDFLKFLNDQISKLNGVLFRNALDLAIFDESGEPIREDILVRVVSDVIDVDVRKKFDQLKRLDTFVIPTRPDPKPDLPTLMEMYEDVFSDTSRRQRALPTKIDQAIKDKIKLNNVVTYGADLKNDGKISEELDTFLTEWVANKDNANMAAKKKKQLLTRAYSPEYTWEAYVGMLRDMDEKSMAELLLDRYSEDDKGSISELHKARLLQCISYAIKMGLNYQKLTEFTVNLGKIPNRIPLDVDDLPYVYPGKLVTDTDIAALKKQKKVHLEDLKALPLYEGITFPEADLGEYIRTSTLKEMKDIPVQLVNLMKRDVLQLIYNISPDFNLNLDELDERTLKKLCGLSMGPIRKQALEYYNCVDHEEHLLARLDEAYNSWLSNNSYLKYIGEISPRQFLNLEPIQAVRIQSVDEVLDGNFDALRSLIYHQKPSMSGPLETSEYEPDIEYARSLSAELQRLGVLPAGYDYLCAVKAMQPGNGGEAKSDEPDAER